MRETHGQVYIDYCKRTGVFFSGVALIRRCGRKSTIQFSRESEILL
jgi:hypothetical protein